MFFQERFAQATDYEDKTMIAIEIINTIRRFDPPGKFLAFDSCSSQWKEISERKSIEKTKQALREDQNLQTNEINAQHTIQEDRIPEPFSDDEVTFLIETFCNK